MKTIKEAIDAGDRDIKTPRTNCGNLNKKGMLEWNDRCIKLLHSIGSEETAPLWVIRNYYQLVAFINEIYEGLPNDLD